MRNEMSQVLRVAAWFAAGTSLLVSAPAATAQRMGRPVVTIAAGAAPYDLSGTGTSVVAAFDVGILLTSFLMVEPGIRYLRYSTQFDATTSYLLPELSVQLRAPTPIISPYLGVGAGGAFIVQGRSDTDVTLHAAVGARTRIGPRWGIRSEARFRSVDPFVGSTFDLTLGISRQM